MLNMKNQCPLRNLITKIWWDDLSNKKHDISGRWFWVAGIADEKAGLRMTGNYTNPSVALLVSLTQFLLQSSRQIATSRCMIRSNKLRQQMKFPQLLLTKLSLVRQSFIWEKNKNNMCHLPPINNLYDWSETICERKLGALWIRRTII